MGLIAATPASKLYCYFAEHALAITNSRRPVLAHGGVCRESQWPRPVASHSARRKPWTRNAAYRHSITGGGFRPRWCAKLSRSSEIGSRPAPRPPEVLKSASFESLLPHSPLDGFEPPTRVDSAGESAHRAQCLCFQYGNRWLPVMATFRTVLRTVLLKTSELTGADETVRPPSGFQWDMCPATTTETIRLIVIAEALLQSGVG